MRYIGIMQLGVPVVFSLTFGKVSVGLELYPNYYKDVSGQDVQVEPYHLAGSISAELKVHCYAHALTDKNYSIRAYFGDENLLHQALKALNTNDIAKDLSRRTLAINSQVSLSGAITVYASYPDKVSVQKYRGYQYIEAKNVPSKLSHEMRRHRSRSLSELCDLYDLSFIIDKENNFAFKRNYRCITTDEEFQYVLENVKTHNKFTFDIETTGTHIYYYGGDRAASDRMIGFGLSWETGQAVYIPLESHVFETLDRQYVIDTLFPLLAEKEVGGANIPFDLRGVYHEGYIFKTWCDVIDNEYLMDPEGSKGKKGLKTLARYYLNEEIPELHEVLGGPVDGNLILYLPKDVITLYGCSDVEPIWRINELQQQHMKTLRAPMLRDRSVDHIIAQCNYYGAYLDVPNLEQMQRIINKDHKELTNLMYDYLQKKLAYLVAKAYYEMQLNNMDVIDFQADKEEDIRILSETDEIKHQVSILLQKKKGKSYERLSFSSYQDVQTIMHKLLSYPIFETDLGELDTSVNDDYLEKLIGFETNRGEDFLISDMISCSTGIDLGFRDAKQELILSKNVFKTRVYPFAYMLKAWRKLDKQKSAFCDKLMSENINGWYCTDYKLTEAATGRIINPVQTVQKFFKHFVGTFPGMYGVNADMKQVELRIMNGEANLLWEKSLENGDKTFREHFSRYSIKDDIVKMSIPWADLHRETGCKMFNTTPMLMTKAQRDASKASNFAQPYGGSPLAVARVQLKGVVYPEQKKRILKQASETIALWKSGNFALNEYLTAVRTGATTPVTNRDLLPPRDKSPFAGDFGIVQNAIGRRRVVDLNYSKIARLIANSQGLVYEYGTPAWERFVSKKSRSIKARIEREAGNHPIQALCADMLRTALNKLYNKGVEMGLCGLGPGKEKLIITLLVHDEFTLQISPEVHPFAVYKLIWDSCVSQLEGHPTYYWGISMIKHWYDGKEDKYDAPVEFVRDMIKAYTKDPERFHNEPGWNIDPQAYVQNYIDKYMRAYAIKHCLPFTKDDVFDYDAFDKANQNYFLANSIGDYMGNLSCVVTNMPRKDMVFIYLMGKKVTKVRYKGKLFLIEKFKFVHEYRPMEIKAYLSDNKSLGAFDETDLFGSQVTDTVLDNFDMFSSDELFNLEDAISSNVDDNINDILQEMNENECINASDDVNFLDASTYNWMSGAFGVDEEYVGDPVKNVGVLDFGSHYFLDATNLTSDTFNGIITYLLQYRDDVNGLPFTVILNNQEIPMQWKLGNNFSKDIVKKFIEEDRSNN